jgi:uncharacterized protein
MSTHLPVDLAPIPHELWETAIPAGTHWSGMLRPGIALRAIDLEGGANISTVFYRREDPLEHYNMADTLKAQRSQLNNPCNGYRPTPVRLSIWEA